MSNWVDEAVHNRPVPVNRQSGGWWVRVMLILRVMRKTLKPSE